MISMKGVIHCVNGSGKFDWRMTESQKTALAKLQCSRSPFHGSIHIIRKSHRQCVVTNSKVLPSYEIVELVFVRVPPDSVDAQDIREPVNSTT